MFDLGLAGKAVGGLALGLGLFWLVARMIREGQKAEIEKLALEAHVLQQEQNKAIVKKVEEDVVLAKDKVYSAAPTDW